MREEEVKGRRKGVEDRWADMQTETGTKYTHVHARTRAHTQYHSHSHSHTERSGRERPRIAHNQRETHT